MQHSQAVEELAIQLNGPVAACSVGLAMAAMGCMSILLSAMSIDPWTTPIPAGAAHCSLPQLTDRCTARAVLETSLDSGEAKLDHETGYEVCRWCC